MKNILVIGSSNVDFVVNVQRTPKPGETLMARGIMKHAGGKGANQAYACGKLGGSVSFLTAVGNDEYGRLVFDSLRSANVDLSGAAVLDGENTGMAIIYVNAEGDNSIVVIPGANEQCTVDFIKRQSEKMEQCGIVALQAEIPLDCVFYVIKRAKQLGKICIFNPAPAPENIPDELYDGLDYITPNETELERLTGVESATMEGVKKGCAALLKKGVKNVICTLGSKGAMLYNDTTQKLYEAMNVRAVDTTGAGDTFNGALAVFLAQGKTAEEAMVFANKASALAVSKKGAQTSIPSLKELNEAKF